MTTTSEEKLYQFWWLHDGLWYQNVARRFGFEAANELNKQCLRALARRSMQAIVRERAVDTRQLDLGQLVELYVAAARTLWPEAWVHLRATITGPDTFEVALPKNFALDWLERAGTLDRYDCPCLELRDGWFQGLGVRFEQEKRDCKCRGAEACTFWARVELPSRKDIHP
jgi:hypothetical protein